MGIIINGEYIQTQKVLFDQIKWGGRFYFAGMTFQKVGEKANRYPEENAFRVHCEPRSVEKPSSYPWCHFGGDTIVQREVKK